MQLTVPVDHGNRLIKTVNHAFPASYAESEYLSKLGDGDVLKYDGRTFTLVDQILPVLNDKTESERYYILTLFALGKELAETADLMRLTPDAIIKVDLLIGLPPQHYSKYMDVFPEYFCPKGKPSDIIMFEMNGLNYRVKITSAHVYPQAFAAAYTVKEKVEALWVANVVDIGGFTVDCLKVNEGMAPDLNYCTSLYYGVRVLFDKINQEVRGDGGNNIDYKLIESVISGNKTAIANISEKRKKLIEGTTRRHVEETLAEIRMNGFDLEEDTVIFVGGGALLLRGYIEATKMVKKPLFIDDIHANAIGYAIMNEEINSAQEAV